MQKLKEKFKKEVGPKLEAEFGIKNPMAVPRLEKIVVNVGVGEISRDKQGFANIKDDLAKITGQFPKIAAARVSVAGFSLRAGMPVGLVVTLRGERMYDFFNRLVSVVLPRLRDFRGVSNRSFDKMGNYTIGIKEHTVFPEIDMAKSPKPHGLEITFVTSTSDKLKSKRLLEMLGMPFTKEEN